MTTYWCEHALLPDGPADAVAVTVDGDSITDVVPDAPRKGTVLAGLVAPGFANAHSHAFHRALRGRTHAGGGTFFTWRERMYAVAQRLDPVSYYRLARLVFTEMVLAGFTSVGEFHYLHHGPGGKSYSDPNALSHSLVAAAGDAGIRLTLLDTCYLASGVDGAPTRGVQQRYSDGDADAWAERLSAFRPGSPLVRVGAAIHSVRAVPVEQLAVPVAWAKANGAPLHAHVSEQTSEHDDCLAVHHRTPTQLLAEAGAVTSDFVGVHVTHPSGDDIGLLGAARAGVCLCPTTERDLGDGIGPGRRLANAGASLSIGTDSHAVIDPFEEMRGVEMHERLATQSRGVFSPAELLAAGTRHSALGWEDVGSIAPGAQADLVRIATDTPRTAGSEPAGIALSAFASDVRDVMVAGRWLVRDGRHKHAANPAVELAAEIKELLR
ncbi:formimidoylglutamate deiminase [Haloechinothrix halophila]|uniref:formimidoylglutamate deiminase n=1 Tax=Haloechinothrix halophila TaxID=1069073 RepID=UPI0003FDE1BF|nr:formimidoylglutamate deiminase [Haloechinothrix halophila]